MGRPAEARPGGPFGAWAERELRERGYGPEAAGEILGEFAAEVEAMPPHTHRAVRVSLILAEGRYFARRRQGG